MATGSGFGKDVGAGVAMAIGAGVQVGGADRAVAAGDGGDTVSRSSVPASEQASADRNSRITANARERDVDPSLTHVLVIGIVGIAKAPKAAPPEQELRRLTAIT